MWYSPCECILLDIFAENSVYRNVANEEILAVNSLNLRVQSEDKGHSQYFPWQQYIPPDWRES